MLRRLPPNFAVNLCSGDKRNLLCKSDIEALIKCKAEPESVEGSESEEDGGPEVFKFGGEIGRDWSRIHIPQTRRLLSAANSSPPEHGCVMKLVMPWSVNENGCVRNAWRNAYIMVQVACLL
ncbi:hypothetical protein M0R45_002964 [Rubus argutus]|uniref:Uncharacterized protein n=1 Tax=Rubus argutus TaxID=59490 RepID=A0AAW1YE53_RUBAR